MEHYIIDADRLREELNKWRDVQPSTTGLPRKATYEAMGVIQTIDHVLYLIDSLQQEQPQVADASKMEQIELEKELENFAKQYPFEDAGSYRNLMTLARHFYELGRKARVEYVRKDALLEWAKEKAEDYKGTANIRRTFELMIKKIESL